MYQQAPCVLGRAAEGRASCEYQRDKAREISIIGAFIAAFSKVCKKSQTIFQALENRHRFARICAVLVQRFVNLPDHGRAGLEGLLAGRPFCGTGLVAVRGEVGIGFELANQFVAIAANVEEIHLR